MVNNLSYIDNCTSGLCCFALVVDVLFLPFEIRKIYFHLDKLKPSIIMVHILFIVFVCFASLPVVVYDLPI